MFGQKPQQTDPQGQRRSTDPRYEAKKKREAERQRKLSATGREIGELPPIANPDRRAACQTDFRKFCETYFPDLFSIPWGRDHPEVLSAIETTVLKGGLFALAMPRGSGKTTLCQIACLWAALYAHHRFIVLIGADQEAASDALEHVRYQLETNPHLAEDFPEVIFPISKLEGITQRRLLFRGRRIRQKITKQYVIFPDIPESVSSGVIFRVAGITSRIRGMNFVVNQKSYRPSLVLIDDPQTDESAMSESMTAARERIVSKAIRGLAGPRQKIAALMPATVIRRGDMVDRLLNPDLHPAWHGRRFKAVYEWPARMDLWEQYITLRHDCQRARKSTKPANDFYRKHREEMDAGAVVAWPDRFEPDELSAIQNAINLRFENKEGAEEAFFCEHQNEPPEVTLGTEKLPTPEALAAQTHGLPRRVVPPEVATLTAHIDVQSDLLFWSVVGWEANFTGYVIDYGTWPEQTLSNFTLQNAPVRLSTTKPHLTTIDARLYTGLSDLILSLCNHTAWKTPDGRQLQFERIGIDAGYKTALIHKFCRENARAALLFPTHGRGIPARNRPMREYKPEPGELIGEFWYRRHGKTKARTIRHLEVDTNAVKSFLFERLATPPGAPGALTFYGKHPTHHALIISHLLSEYRTKVSANGREVDEWSLRPSRPDNHWLDTICGNIALASYSKCQVTLPPGDRKPTARKRRAPREAEYL